MYGSSPRTKRGLCREVVAEERWPLVEVFLYTLFLLLISKYCVFTRYNYAFLRSVYFTEEEGPQQRSQVPLSRPFFPVNPAIPPFLPGNPDPAIFSKTFLH